jgi:DNA-binding response OmpR family regulator
MEHKLAESLQEIHAIYAEDDLDIAQSLMRVFKRIFAKVEHFENGKNALDYFLENKDNIDLVITDITMPIMNGIDFVKEVRRNMSLDKPPVVAITAYSTEYSNELSNLNVNVFNKPLDIDLFKEGIEKIFLK